MRTFVLFLAALLLAVPTFAQESQFASDVRREGEKISDSCAEFTLKSVGGCIYSIATESPIHITFGNIAPLNGLGWGLALSEHSTPNESWRLLWNADAVRAFSGSSRAGFYMKMIHTPETSGVGLAAPGPAPVASRPILPRELTVINLYVQTISLNTISFYGLGQNSFLTARSVFGERETILGSSVAYPFSDNAWHPALIAGINGRFFDIRPGSDDAPSIEQLYDDNSAPGLAAQKAFVEFHEGIRVKPSLATGRLRLNYVFSAQQFRTASETRSSFNRWTLDLRHEIPIYREEVSTGPREFNGPDDCRTNFASPDCPPVQWSRNREGTISLRVLLNRSQTGDDDRVPFFLQPTLGGSDLDGERLLASYDDYRFRGPNRLVFQESLEHVIKGPVGAFVQFEQGRVSGDQLSSGDFALSTTIGVTLRAGGFPAASLSFSWGGGSHHVIGWFDTTLLGGSARPSLY